MADQGSVLITGAGGGLGRGVAERLAAQGRGLVLLDIDESRLAETAAAVSARQVPVTCHVVDIRDVDALEAAVGTAFESHEDLSALVNVAGLGGFRPYDALEVDDWDRTYAVNVRGTFFAIQAFAGHLAERRRAGSVVNFSSIAARNGNELLTAYGSSKAAVLAMTQSLARALAPTVRVNAVLPGLIWTDMWKQSAEWLAENDPALRGVPGERIFDTMVEQLIPLKRAQTVGDVAGAVAYLLSEDAVNVTGQTLHVDGGAVLT
ncbi:SDR family NAD(P)-dependent oxidoreductase [Rhodococcus sp. NPDC059234]|uniref:SDR family NAD(P)-dependent oxidoreductase n=1 Tax=Rhodococcus sp. NPDC059234 TaxID=3346781 RepID=UPI00366D2FFC